MLKCGNDMCGNDQLKLKIPLSQLITPDTCVLMPLNAELNVDFTLLRIEDATEDTEDNPFDTAVLMVVIAVLALDLMLSHACPQVDLMSPITLDAVDCILFHVVDISDPKFPNAVPTVDSMLLQAPDSIVLMPSHALDAAVDIVVQAVDSPVWITERALLNIDFMPSHRLEKKFLMPSHAVVAAVEIVVQAVDNAAPISVTAVVKMV